MLPNDAAGDVDPRSEVREVERMFPLPHKEMFALSLKICGSGKEM